VKNRQMCLLWNVILLFCKNDRENVNSACIDKCACYEMWSYYFGKNDWENVNSACLISIISLMSKSHGSGSTRIKFDSN